MRNSEILPGGVKRLSVAVLLNDIVTPGTEGEVTRTPRSEAEMADLTELVTMAAGLDTERGDALSVKSLAFDILPELPMLTGPQTNNLLGAGDDDPINALKEAVSDQTQEAAALLTQWLDQDKVA